jgi:hypothetical protein
VYRDVVVVVVVVVVCVDDFVIFIQAQTDSWM